MNRLPEKWAVSFTKRSNYVPVIDYLKRYYKYEGNALLPVCYGYDGGSSLNHNKGTLCGTDDKFHPDTVILTLEEFLELPKEVTELTTFKFC